MPTPTPHEIRSSYQIAHDEAVARLTEYGRTLAADGFQVWLTETHDRSGGYLQYRDPATGCWGSLQCSYFGEWVHHMDIVPSQEFGSSMWIDNPTEEGPWTVDAARVTARTHNWNSAVGRQANARDKTWISNKAVPLHDTTPEA